MFLLNNRFAPITKSMGLIKANLDKTREYYSKWTRGFLAESNQGLTEAELACGLPEALNRLPPLSSGVPTRALLLALGDGWTVFFDNLHLGTDPAGVAAVLSRDMNTTTLRLTVTPNTVRAKDPRPSRGHTARRSLRCLKGACEAGVLSHARTTGGDGFLNSLVSHIRLKMSPNIRPSLGRSALVRSCSRNTPRP